MQQKVALIQREQSLASLSASDCTTLSVNSDMKHACSCTSFESNVFNVASREEAKEQVKPKVFRKLNSFQEAWSVDIVKEDRRRAGTK